MNCSTSDMTGSGARVKAFPDASCRARTEMRSNKFSHERLSQVRTSPLPRNGRFGSVPQGYISMTKVMTKPSRGSLPAQVPVPASGWAGCTSSQLMNMALGRNARSRTLLPPAQAAPARVRLLDPKEAPTR